MIEIGTFGGLIVRKDNKIICRNLGRVTGQLLVYFAINTDLVLRRESIAELFWPEKCEARSRALLNTSIWRINETLKSSGIAQHFQIERISDTAICIELSPSVMVDVTELAKTVAACERCLAQIDLLDDDLRRNLRRALESYHGAFLEGSDSDWVLRARERYRCVHARGMTILMRAYALSGRIEEALDCGRAILERDEFRETTQRAMMWLYVMNGQRGEAIACYGRLKKRLKDEIGVEPMRETTALFQHILTDTDLADQAERCDAGTLVTAACDDRELRAQCESRAKVFESIVRPDTHAI
jgi:DNA-binding SARP family transcriptional activator